MTNAVTPDVSLILPVYNVARYLPDCLQSIVAQDFSGRIEALLIDDASTDGSAEACRRFVSAHPEIFQLIECRQNAGVSVARNLGLERARGHYLVFVDPDDVLPVAALSSLHAAAEEHAADIVKGNLVLFDEAGERPAPDRVRSTTRVNGDAVLATLFEHARIRGHIGAKLLRRESCAEIRFPVGVRMAQDLLYFSEVFARADSLVLIDEVVYRYRKHSGGSTGGKYARGSYLDWLDAVERAGDFARSPRQRRAHRGLLVRTLAQIAREIRHIPAADAAPVLAVIEQRIGQWRIDVAQLLWRDRPGLRTLGRYAKLRLALGRIRRNLSAT